MSRVVYSLRALAALGLCSAQAACLSGPQGSDAIDEATASSEEAMMSTNRLSMNRLSMNRLQMNGLSMGKLSTNGTDLAPTTLIETVEGRELLTYLVRCSLPGTQSLTGTYNSTTYTFQGGVGIAPMWISEPLSKTGQRWVTACLLAHVNGYGVEVPISLRGDLSSLGTTAAEVADYTVQEAAFYGNIFVPTSDPDYGLFVCAGSTVQSQCGASASTYSPQRSCGTSVACDVAFVGPCRNEANPDLHACAITSGGTVDDCYPETKGVNNWATAVKYGEVVTVYLKPVDFGSLYASCDAIE
jgi:hypothetical protein